MKLFQKNNLRLGLPYFVMALLLYLSIFGIRLYSKHSSDPQTIYNKFQKELKIAEGNAQRTSGFLLSHFDTTTNVIPGSILEAAKPEREEGHYMFIFKGDSLIFWNNNKTILPEKLSGRFEKSFGMAKLKNGWYGFQCARSGQYLFLSCYLIKSEFPFQNDYVKNSFSSQFSCPGSVSIEMSRGRFPLMSVSGSYLFSLNFSKYTGSLVVPPVIIFLLLVVGSMCLFCFIYRMYRGFTWFDNRRNLLVLAFGLNIFLLRLIQHWLRFPAELYQSELFSPALYSSTAILPSLGDFTLNVILIFVVCLALYLNGRSYPAEQVQSKSSRFPVNFLTIFTLLIFFHFVGFMVADLIVNSSLPLNLQDVSGLKFESGYGLYIIAFLLFSFWFMSSRFLNDVFTAGGRKMELVLPAGIAGLLYGVLSWLIFGAVDYYILLFFFVYLIFFWYIEFRKQALFSVQNVLFFLFFYSVFATFLLNRSNHQKENERLDLLAVKLATRRNPVTEVLFEQLQRKLLADSVARGLLQITSTVNASGQDSLIHYLKNKYFKDYWKKYNIQITVCDSIKELRIQPQGYLVNCGSYFRGIIHSYGEVTLLPNLFFLDYGFGKEYYLALLSGKGNNVLSDAGQTIIIELNLLNAYPDPGYPGLLMDNARMDIPNLSEYSYGLFQNKRLVHSVGPYSYRMELGRYKAYSANNPFFIDDQMIHYQFHINKTNSLLISKKEETLLTPITPFSYLFILFSVIALLVTVIVNFPENLQIIPSSLRNRLHFSLIGILVVTLLVIGIVQVINIININSKKNIANLREKAYSVQVEVQHRYAGLADVRSIARSDLEDFMVKLSNVFFTDINFYSENGILLASSRQQIFDEGLVSSRMNATAYEMLILKKGSSYIHNESIGKMHFSSAYLPLYNEQNDLLGYINLPYFSRQDELKKEISSFLVTFINIYILLILFGVFVTILISNYITAPLSMLAGKMSRIRLGKVNEKIDWNNGDEIGQLVMEYNRMIDELGRSAEMLAKSERESAWREMARQVAHEIKNPLTPMKLSAQYLQKAWIDKAPDMGERLVRFTKTLIEQIDTLSAIASDFSSFAKRPVVINERINLEEIIHFVLSMYEGTSEIRYEFKSETDDPHIWADRALMIRIFTNLLNNAVQAIGVSPNGLISIRLSSCNQEKIIAVSDNGSGISSGRADKIFQPDFTTKTGGMGLGLAIVKGIVEGMNGEISFTSAEHKGATFIIKLPSNADQKQNEKD